MAPQGQMAQDRTEVSAERRLLVEALNHGFYFLLRAPGLIGFSEQPPAPRLLGLAQIDPPFLGFLPVLEKLREAVEEQLLELRHPQARGAE